MSPNSLLSAWWPARRTVGVSAICRPSGGDWTPLWPAKPVSLWSFGSEHDEARPGIVDCESDQGTHSEAEQGSVVPRRQGDIQHSINSEVTDETHPLYAQVAHEGSQIGLMACRFESPTSVELERCQYSHGERDEPSPDRVEAESVQLDQQYASVNNEPGRSHDAEPQELQQSRDVGGDGGAQTLLQRCLIER